MIFNKISERELSVSKTVKDMAMDDKLILGRPSLIP